MAKVRMYHAASDRYQYDAAENFEVHHQPEGWVLAEEEVDMVDAVAAPDEADVPVEVEAPVADAPAETPKRGRAK